MYGFHFTLRVLGVGSIQDTQCGFKVRPSLPTQRGPLTPRCTALHPARRAGYLPASAPGKLDLRRRASPTRLTPTYSRERSPCALARSRWQQAQRRHCHHGHGIRLAGDAIELRGRTVERLGWVCASGCTGELERE